jgi:hypothetical protein
VAEEGSGYRGYLPPEPPGEQPELGGRPQSPPPWQQPGQAEPDNEPAMTGFVLALVGAGLLVLSGGLLAVVSLVLAIFGLVHSRRGKRRIESGATGRHRGIAQAGFVTSVVTLVIAASLTLLELLALILYAVDEDFREEFKDEWNRAWDGVVLLAVPILRALARLFA